MAGALRTVQDLEIPRVRCASFHSALDVDAAGTIGAYDIFLCVEIPLPWQRDISMSEPFLGLFGAGVSSWRTPDGRRLRPQGLVPRPGADGRTRVLVLERPAGGSDDAATPAGPYRRREWSVDPDEVLDLCKAYLEQEPGSLDRFADSLVDTPEGLVDLFVCTHGRRDTCCGSAGTALFDGLVDRLNREDPSERVRVWRVSHTGGHRFAPTALTFPDGYAWAHLDEEQALGIALRSLEPADLRSQCRGVSSLAGAPAQVADHAALLRVGWDWAVAEREVVVTGFDRTTMATDLRVEGTVPDGTHHAFNARVEVERYIPQVTCGAIDGPEYDVEPVWRVTSFERA